MSISADTLRGHTDIIILAQLMRGDNYGYEINKNISQCTQGEYGFKEATLYTAFKRLEQSGRRYYAITDEGRRHWAEGRQEWENTRALLDALTSAEED